MTASPPDLTPSALRGAGDVHAGDDGGFPSSEVPTFVGAAAAPGTTPAVEPAEVPELPAPETVTRSAATATTTPTAPTPSVVSTSSSSTIGTAPALAPGLRPELDVVGDDVPVAFESERTAEAAEVEAEGVGTPPVRRSKADRAVSWIVGAIVVAGTTVGLSLRLWFVFHFPSNSDEGVAGLITQAGLHGHFQAFYGGQFYGGTAETYVMMLPFTLFGQTVLVARLTLLVMAVLDALVVWRIVHRIVGSHRVALLSAVLFWSASVAVMRTSVDWYGFRDMTMICGLVGILLALRCFDRGPRTFESALLGIVVGVGWWSSPEIVYFGIPIVAYLFLAVLRTPGPRRPVWLRPLVTVVVGFELGALPWIWANTRSGFRSLSTSSPGLVDHATYIGRLSEFFHQVVPTVLGLRLVADATSSVGSAYSILYTVCLVVVGATAVLCALRGGAALVLAIALVAFPFVYAISPFSDALAYGRYGFYFVPLVAMVVGVGAFEGARRLRLPTWSSALAVATVVVLLCALSISGNNRSNRLEASGFVSGWANPDRSTMATVDRLEAAGVRTGYANYWVAYKLDFYGRGRLELTTAGYDTNRLPWLNQAVRHSRRPAWLFVSLGESRRDGTQFGAPSLTVGPDGVTEHQFLARLRFYRVRYRLIDTGLVTAVLPAATLTPYQAGLPATTPP